MDLVAGKRAARGPREVGAVTMGDNDDRHLAGALYASCDGHRVWLRYDDKFQYRICLEPAEADALVKYLQGIRASQMRRARRKNARRRAFDNVRVIKPLDRDA